MTWQNEHEKKKVFTISSKEHLFPLPTNSNGTRKYKSYTRNSFGVEHRADLHFEHRNHETERALCFASRSDSIKLYLSFHPCSQLSLWLAPSFTHTFRSFHMLTSPSLRTFLRVVILKSGECIYYFFSPVCCILTLASAIFQFVLGNLLEVSLTDEYTI